MCIHKNWEELCFDLGNEAPANPLKIKLFYCASRGEIRAFYLRKVGTT